MYFFFLKQEKLDPHFNHMKYKFISLIHYNLEQKRIISNRERAEVGLTTRFIKTLTILIRQFITNILKRMNHKIIVIF